jgi:hypothetical protein
MFGFGKRSRMKKLWENIGSQLSDLLAFYRKMNGGSVPEWLKTDKYVIGYHYMMSINLYVNAVNGRTEPEEQGFVVLNSISIALEIPAETIASIIESEVRNSYGSFHSGIRNAKDAIEKLNKGDSTAFLEFNSNLKKLSQRISNPTNSDEVNADNSTLSLFAEMAHSDPNAQVRAEAQKGFKSLFPGSVNGYEEMVDKFISGLKETGNAEKQNLAAVALAGMGEMAVPKLKLLLADENPTTRQAAIKVLTMIEQDQTNILKKNCK